MSSNATIQTNTFLADVENELSDLYIDGGITAAIYNLKNQTRPIVHALIQADRFICLQLKVAAHIAIFVPSGQRTIFFSRQKEHVGDFINQYADVKATDKGQYALFLAQDEFLDVVSVLSTWAYAYDKIPIASAQAKEKLENSEPGQLEGTQARKYSTTSGAVKYEQSPTKRFYCEPNTRKMVLSDSFAADRWLRFKAQIAPIEPNAAEYTKSEIDNYVIRSPYFARQWLLMVTMQRLLSTKGAQAGGYYDLEQKFKKDAFDNKPGTGNVIISGSELDGNYEAELNDF